MKDKDKLFTLTEAAALAGVSSGTMYRFVIGNKVQAVPTASPCDRRRNMIMIPQASLVAFLDGLAATATRRAQAAKK